MGWRRKIWLHKQHARFFTPNVRDFLFRGNTTDRVGNCISHKHNWAIKSNLKAKGLLCRSISKLQRYGANASPHLDDLLIMLRFLSKWLPTSYLHLKQVFFYSFCCILKAALLHLQLHNAQEGSVGSVHPGNDKWLGFCLFTSATYTLSPLSSPLFKQKAQKLCVAARAT